MTLKCPLCCSLNNSQVEVLDPSVLSLLYVRRLGIELRGIPEKQIELRLCSCCGLEFYHPSLPGEEEFYQSLQKFDWYYLSDKEEYTVASQHITETSSVLEVGVGYGFFAERIIAKTYVGLELSNAAVAEARSRGLSVYKTSVEEYAIEHREEHDVVCSFQVLEHVPNPRSFVEASLQCLKPGGKFIQSVPSETAFLGKEVNNVLNMPPHHMTRWTDRALRSVAELFSLRVVEIHHDTLAGFHAASFAATQARIWLNRVSGRKHRSLDPAFATLCARAGVRFLSFLPEMYVRCKRLKPMGHSVTAVYVKI